VRRRRRIAPTNNGMASTIRVCYRISPVDGNPDPVEIAVGQSFGEPQELIAEMGAAMLAGITGIERKTLANSAAYLKSWIDVLKSDSRMVVFAASQAQKAADYIQGVRQ
jgi:hypothetical protein